MKKFYLLFVMAIAVLGFTNQGIGQTYTATSTGNWTSGATWDINGAPAPICTDCTITINPSVTVTLNTDILLKGNSLLTIGNGAKILITPSTNVPPATTPMPVSGYHRIDMVYGDNVKIVLTSSTSVIDASTTLAYDGVYLYVPIGNPQLTPYFALQRMGTATPSGLWPPSTITTLGGPTTLTTNGTLPILLSSFDAVLDKNSVDLTWTSAIEINSDFIEIQHSSDGSAWSSIGHVKAKGFSSISVDYSFTDNSPFNGINYYRLKLVDLDSKFKYSEIKVVRAGVAQGYKIFPNPAKDYVNISIGTNAADQLTFRLVNQSGQVLQEKKFSHVAGSTVSLPVFSYPQGNYVLTISGSNGEKETKTVLIAR